MQALDPDIESTAFSKNQKNLKLRQRCQENPPERQENRLDRSDWVPWQPFFQGLPVHGNRYLYITISTTEECDARSSCFYNNIYDME